MVGEITNGIPTDVGPYVVVVSLFIVVAIGFNIAVRWLDARDRVRAASFESRITALEAEVARRTLAHKAAAVLIGQALARCPSGDTELAGLLIQALAALE